MVLPGPQGPFHIHSEINRVGGWAKFNLNGAEELIWRCAAQLPKAGTVSSAIAVLIVQPTFKLNQSNCEGE